MLTTPDHLQGHVSQLIATEQVTACRKQLWPVILGLEPQLDGNQWMILWGPDLAIGVAGFGDTPLAAMQDFEVAMESRIRPRGGDLVDTTKNA